MNYHVKYRIEDFPLLKFTFLKLPDRMLKELFLIMGSGEGVVVGGAAAAIQLGEYNKLGDIDIIMRHSSLAHIYDYMAISDLQVYWDTNYYGDKKCAIFFPVDKGFHKVELSFRLQLPPTHKCQVLINDLVCNLPCASCEWLLLNKLEKILRADQGNLMEAKFSGHVETSIKLVEHMRCQNLTVHYPELAAQAKKMLSQKFYTYKSLGRLPILINMIDSANL